jgi:flagellar biosynthesis activator protein FlaF
MTFMSNIKTEMSMLEEDAFALTQAALEISQAQETKDERRLAAALDKNLQLWVGIRTLVERDGNPLPTEVKANLSRLSHFVAQKTFEMQDGSNDKTLEALANTNLQIAEGLLESKAS